MGGRLMSQFIAIVLWVCAYVCWALLSQRILRALEENPPQMEQEQLPRQTDKIRLSQSQILETHILSAHKDHTRTLESASPLANHHTFTRESFIQYMHLCLSTPSRKCVLVYRIKQIHINTLICIGWTIVTKGKWYHNVTKGYKCKVDLSY